MVASVIIVISLVVLVMAFYFSKIKDYLQADGFESSLFLAGASIYTGTFIFSSNWDYRMIFLGLCVPFVETKRFPLGGIFVILIIVAMNESILTPWLGRPGLAIVLLAKIAVFAVLSAYLAALALTIFLHFKPLKHSRYAGAMP